MSAQPARERTGREVVVYCSADAAYSKAILDEFTKRTGIEVKAVFDTEATKTFGLVQRLINEHDEEARGARRAGAGADVFFSSEPLGMIRLAKAGVLEERTAARAEEAFEHVGGWPRTLRASDETWYGFARRGRVIVYNTNLVKGEDVPRTLAALADAKFKGRVGIARAQFGTTRAHIAALYMACPEAYESWLKSLKANGARLYDGNGAVMRAVATGEIRVGLTDTDDVYAGLANGWPLGMVMVSGRLAGEEGGPCEPTSDAGDSAAGAAAERRAAQVQYPEFPDLPLYLPHTVGVIKGARNAEEAAEFVEFLLSRDVDAMMAEGEARTFRTYGPWMEPAADEGEAAGAESPGAAGAKQGEIAEVLRGPSMERIAEEGEEALAVFERVFEGRK